MQKFRPTHDEWFIIKQMGLFGSYNPLPSINHVSLEARKSSNTEDKDKDVHINMALVTSDFAGGCNDTDLWDSGTQYTKEFRKGVELTEDGTGLFDFYIYNRYDRDHGELRGNVLVKVLDGKMHSIWIEGGRAVSWTPETGIVHRALRGR